MSSTHAVISPDPAWLTEADMERAIGKGRVRELFSEREGARQEEIGALLREYLTDAERLAESYLLSNFVTREKVAELARNDPRLRRMACLCAAEARSIAKPGFVSEDGRGRYSGSEDKAIEYFKALQKSQVRSSGEEAAGDGVNVGGDLKPVVNPPERRSVFGPVGRGPNGGKPTSRF